MDLTAEAIDKIVAMTKAATEPREIIYNGNKVTIIDGKVYPSTPGLPGRILMNTLDGLVEFVKRGFDRKFMTGTPFIQVCDPHDVRYMGEAEADTGRRCMLAEAVPTIPEFFPFGRFLSTEEFIIKIQALFVRGCGDWDNVIASCAGIKKQDGVEYKDSGVSQEVVVQSGISLKSRETLPNPVMLAPFRTFPEIEQPASPFILRVTDGKDQPLITLFEADGGAWKNSAIKRIAEYLKQALPEVPIIA